MRSNLNWPAVADKGVVGLTLTQNACIGAINRAIVEPSDPRLKDEVFD